MHNHILEIMDFLTNATKVPRPASKAAGSSSQFTLQSYQPPSQHQFTSYTWHAGRNKIKLHAWNNFRSPQGEYKYGREIECTLELMGKRGEARRPQIN